MTSVRKTEAFFFRLINGKSKRKERVARLKEYGVLIKNFQKVFTTESEFDKPQTKEKN